MKRTRKQVAAMLHQHKRNTLKVLLLTFLGVLSQAVYAQNNVDEFLSLVEQNNQELKAAYKLMEAQQMGFQTGLTPDNPSIEYGHFPGKQEEIGNKTTYGISQSFDFPTVYSVRKKLANDQSQLSEYEYQLFRQAKLLEAQLGFYQYAFLLKKQRILQKRLEHAEQLYQSYQTKFERGNASVLDANKARIQYLKTKSNNQLLVQELDAQQRDLQLLSGQTPDTLVIVCNPADELPSLETVLSDMQQLQPEVRYLQQAQQVADRQIKLAKQNWLPELELGYESEKAGDGTYRGVRGGLSIPLWKDKNKVKQAKAQAIFEEQRYSSRLSSLVSETQKRYKQAEELNKIWKEYDQTLKEAANIGFLDKALQLGHLSVIDYFNELAFYYETIDTAMEIENNYIQTLAKLQAYKL
ncbi:TolC family protein [Sunxiuqinia elliptica]